MAYSMKATILILAIILLVFVIAIGVLYTFSRPQNVESDEIISSEPNLTTPLLGPWRSSWTHWTHSWHNSWTDSWTWLRHNKHDQLLPTCHNAPNSHSINPPTTTTEHIVPSTEAAEVIKPLQYTILSYHLARAVPKAEPRRFDATFTTRNQAPWVTEGPASPLHWRLTKSGRKYQPSNVRGISPYRPSSGVHHSQPIAITRKEDRRERPTFPFPEKLVWKALTPYERAGMVWYRNAAY